MPIPCPDDMPCPFHKHSRNIDQYNLCPLAKDFSDRTASTSIPLLSQPPSSASFLTASNTADSRQTPDLGEWPYSSFHHQCSHRDTALHQTKRPH